MLTGALKGGSSAVLQRLTGKALAALSFLLLGIGHMEEGESQALLCRSRAPVVRTPNKAANAGKPSSEKAIQ